jgi:hypothetical protein
MKNILIILLFLVSKSFASFTLSGSTITQTGTDTSFAGLNGLAGVTRISTGDGFLYSMPTINLVINGTLTITNPAIDTIICNKISINGTGNYTSGSYATDGVTPLRNGCHFKIVGGNVAAGSFGGPSSLEIDTNGQLTLIGGYYEVAGGTYYSTNAIIREYFTKVICTRAYTTSSGRVRAYSSNVVKRNCEHYDYAYDLFVNPTEFSVKGFGAEYIAQGLGAGYGGSDSKFTASSLSNIDGTYDFDNFASGWVELYNCAKGANLNVVTQNTNPSVIAVHCVPLFQDVNIKVINLQAVVQNNVRYKCIDVPINSPTTTLTTFGGLKTWDFRSPITYTGTTNASGVSSVSPVLQVWHGASNTKNLRFPLSTATFQFRAYGLETQNTNIVLGSDVAQTLNVAMVTVNNLTLTETQALALTGITFTPSGTTGGVVTISSARTVVELWQAYRAWIAQFANFGSNDTWTYNGTNLNLGAWTITGIQNLSNGTVTTSSATAGGAISNISIIGNVTQTTPTDLTSVNISGNLTYSTATAITVNYTNTTVNKPINTGVGIVTIQPAGNTTVNDTTDPEILFLDSYIAFTSCNATDVIQMLKVSDNSIIQSLTISANTTMRFKYVNYGTVYFLRKNASGAILGSTRPTPTTLIVGNNGTIDIKDVSQYANESALASYLSAVLPASIWSDAIVPTRTTSGQMSETTLNNKLNTINSGVQKASLAIPHTENLPQN